MKLEAKEQLEPAAQDWSASMTPLVSIPTAKNIKPRLRSSRPSTVTASCGAITLRVWELSVATISRSALAARVAALSLMKSSPTARLTGFGAATELKRRELKKLRSSKILSEPPADRGPQAGSPLGVVDAGD